MTRFICGSEKNVFDLCVPLRSSELSRHEVLVLNAQFIAPNIGFDSVVVAPPEVELFNHWPMELHSRVYLVAPAYKSEFKDGSTARDFRHQIGRKDGWRVPIYNWNRSEKTAPSWQ